MEPELTRKKKLQKLREAKEIGHYMAELAADKAGDAWKAEAAEALVEYAKTHEFFTAEDIRAANPEIGCDCDLRAWGSIIRCAVIMEIITFSKFVPVVSSRGGAKSQWQSLIYKRN